MHVVNAFNYSCLCYRSLSGLSVKLALPMLIVAAPAGQCVVTYMWIFYAIMQLFAQSCPRMIEHLSNIPRGCLCFVHICLIVKYMTTVVS